MTTVDVTLSPGERAMVPTGVSIALPDGYVALIHPRSGLAAASGVSIVNAPGTVDAGYRGEIRVLLINLDPHRPVELRRGDRIAQVVFQQVERARFVEVERLRDQAAGTAATARRVASSARTEAPHPYARKRRHGDLSSSLGRQVGGAELRA